MAGASRFDCYPSDFLNGVIGLNADEISTYTIVMMLQYDRGEAVPYKGRERELQVRSGLPRGRLDKAVARLVEIGKLSLIDGALFNERTSKELQKISERIEINRENSLKGGNANREKWNKKHKEINASCDPNGYPNGYPKNSPIPSSFVPRPDTTSVPDVDNAPATHASKKSRPVAPTPVEILETCLTPQTARDLVTHRKAKRAPLTARAAELLAKAFADFGDAELAAQTVIARGWTGFKSEWMTADARAGPMVPPQNNRNVYVSLADQKRMAEAYYDRLEEDERNQRGIKSEAASPADAGTVPLLLARPAGR